MCYVPLKLAIVVRLASSLHTRLLKISRCSSLFALFMVVIFGSMVSASNADGMTPTAAAAAINSTSLLSASNANGTTSTAEAINSTSLVRASNANGMARAATNLNTNPKQDCRISNFQFPPNKLKSHLVLTPRDYIPTSGTVDFKVKMKRYSRFPRILSYAKDANYNTFAVEIPGTGYAGYKRAADSDQVLKKETSFARDVAGYYLFFNGKAYGVAYSHAPLNVWTRVTITWDSHTTHKYAIYVNGIRIGGGINTNLKGTIPSGGKLFMGQQQLLSDAYRFTGRIIDLQMWDLTFSVAEVGNLQKHNISPKVQDKDIILNVPPTYGNVLKNGATCQAECREGYQELLPHDDDFTIVCKKCPKGKFSKGIGNSECTLCPPGHFNPSEGQSMCKPCPTGEFQTQSGQPLCIKCAAGKYTIQSGSQTCKPCGLELPRKFTDKFSQCLDGKLAIIKSKISTNIGKISSNTDDISKNYGKISTNIGKISSNTDKIANNQAAIDDLKKKIIRCETGVFECTGKPTWAKIFDVNYGTINYRYGFHSKPHIMLALSTLDTLEEKNPDGNDRENPNQIQEYIGVTGSVYAKFANENGFTAYCHSSNFGRTMTVGGSWMACGTGQI